MNDNEIEVRLRRRRSRPQRGFPERGVARANSRSVVIAPELLIEPLGSLVKTVPTIILMLTALAILDDR